MRSTLVMSIFVIISMFFVFSPFHFSTDKKQQLGVCTTLLTKNNNLEYTFPTSLFAVPGKVFSVRKRFKVPEELTSPPAIKNAYLCLFLRSRHGRQSRGSIALRQALRSAAASENRTSSTSSHRPSFKSSQTMSPRSAPVMLPHWRD